MKLDLDKNLLDLRGMPKDELLCELLANILVSSSTHRPAQTYVWGHDLIKNGEIEISKDDGAFISDVITKSQIYTDLVKAQLLEEIEKLKD